MARSENVQWQLEAGAYEIVAQLPLLPPVIRYYDDFDDKQRSIRDPTTARCFSVHIDGRAVKVGFDHLSEQLALLIKHVFLHLLGEGLALSSASKYALGSKAIGEAGIVSLLGVAPTEIGSFWSALFSRGLPTEAYACAKSILRLLCKYRLNQWSDSYHGVISALPLPFKDKYAVVRSGEAFISVDDESAIVRFLDESVIQAKKSLLALEELQDAAMLLCAYQFAMRPIQIAMLTFRDVKFRREDVGMLASVHITFRMAKQRSSSSAKPLLRRVKREWTPLFAEIDRYFQASGDDAGARVFGATSANEASRRISSLLRDFLELGATAVNLRHTAAQRLVDAGASQEELAEFLGHSDMTTALVYYETSANQAERVNKALGISEIYRRVARIAHDRFIGPEELAQLKESQQIGGAPHGVPIAGIGGCTSGQAACPYNPILSCYGCRKFMPIHDVQMHSRVLADFRDVARFFHDSSRSDAVSPAYIQLERTIAEVQAVVVELEGSPC